MGFAILSIVAPPSPTTTWRLCTYYTNSGDLKPSTRQRFIALEFSYPPPEAEAEIVSHESGLEMEEAGRLVRLAELTRNLREQGLAEGASTRILVHAGKLMASGISPEAACLSAVCQPLTDDPELLEGLVEMVRAVY